MHKSLSLVGAALLVAVPLALAVPRGVGRSTVLLDPRQAQETYDYVIVGGGTAGLTVADRLTEDGKTTVLVIEVGDISMNIPSVFGSLVSRVQR
jgi:choline dehydrogenase